MQENCWSKENNRWCSCKLQIHGYENYIIQIKEWAINEIKVRKCFIAELFKQVILVRTGEVRQFLCSPPHFHHFKNRIISLKMLIALVFFLLFSNTFGPAIMFICSQYSLINSLLFICRDRIPTQWQHERR